MKNACSPEGKTALLTHASRWVAPAGIAIVLLFLGTLARAEWGIVDQNEEHSFDAKNSLKVEEIGRVETRDDQGNLKMVQHGEFYRFHVRRDGAAFDLDLKGDLDVVSSRTSAIDYADKDHVWVVGDGHANDVLSLIDMANRKLTFQRFVINPELSPDGTKAAYFYRDPLRIEGKERYIAFINDTLVWPFIEGGFTEWADSGPKDGVQKRDGTKLEDFLKAKPHDARYLYPQLKWEHKDRQDRLILRVLNDENGTTATRYAVTGIADVKSSAGRNVSGVGKLKLEKVAVERYERGEFSPLE